MPFSIEILHQVSLYVSLPFAQPTLHFFTSAVLKGSDGSEDGQTETGTHRNYLLYGSMWGRPQKEGEEKGHGRCLDSILAFRLGDRPSTHLGQGKVSPALTFKTNKQTSKPV